MLDLQNKNKGISLIEVLIAVGLILIVGVALVRLGVVALTNSDASRVRAAALQLADEALEVSRSIRDASPDVFFNLTDGNYELNSTQDGFVATACDPLDAPFFPPGGGVCEIQLSLGDGQQTFYRIVRITDTVGVTDSKDLTAYVLWNNQGTYSNVVSGTVLTRWRE